MNARVFKALAMALMASTLAGCVTTQQRQAFLNEFKSRDIDPTVYIKIERHRPLDVSDIAHLTSKGVPEDLIIKHIDSEQTVYHLQTPDIDRLREAKASEELINYLLNTPALYGRNFPPYYWGPYYYHPPFYYPFGPYWHLGPHYGHWGHYHYRYRR